MDTSGRHSFYVDVPHGYDYKWDGKNTPTCSEALTREYGIPIEFVVNSFAKISKGDAHRVTVDNEGDELLFLLRTGFEKLETQKLKNYEAAKAARKR